jgi:Zn-dependent peptidase ImmA (M78 family)
LSDLRTFILATLLDIFTVAHETFHYLRKTRQVAGRHGEIEADAFALKALEQYREWSNTW